MPFTDWNPQAQLFLIPLSSEILGRKFPEDRRPSKVLRTRPLAAMSSPESEPFAERCRVLKQYGAWFDIRKGRYESPLLSCSAFCDCPTV